MTELNLLPDVKMEYIKAQKMRRMVFTVSALVTAAAVILLVSMISVNQLQKKHIKDLSADISRESADLKGKKDINKILTVQNQLNSLTALHAAKPAAANLFDYLNQVTPSTITINSFHSDFTTYAMTITGGADSLSDVNKYIDTLKFTTYKADDGSSGAAFGNVVMGSFNLSTVTSNGGKPATYTISLNYDPKIFDITKKVTLDVPSRTTTRASIDNPPALFQAGPAPTTGTGTGSTGTGTTGTGSTSGTGGR